MDVLSAVSSIFASFGLSSSAGLNAYIPLLAVSLITRFYPQLLKLGEQWDWLSSWWTIGVLAVLCAVEFFADKVPAVNHVNDGIQTFVRPAAGAILFAANSSVITDMHPVLAGVLGLMVAGGVHVAKSAVLRPAVTATTGGIGSPVVSFLEDVVALFVSILSLVLPILIGIFLIGSAIWFTYWILTRPNKKSSTPAY
ncbi:MAG TPA: DUF4126 domain-containing protein [Anaerolineales bacterium]|nr:DUF4126 domain-containing protein [Anaerolineales bacterium]